jgi:hypothetical protein
MFMHLLLDGDLLANQVAAAARQPLELDVHRLGLRLEQAEAIDGGAVVRGQIGVIRLVGGVGGQAELLGGERVDAAVYMVKVAVPRGEVGRGAYRGRVKLGMTGQAEIVTGRESLLSLLVKRIRQTISLG